MNTDFEILKIINTGNVEDLADISDESLNIIKDKINEVPSNFFEPNIVINKEIGARISLIEFSMDTVGMSYDKKKALMDKYHVDPYDMDKLQRIIDSINVAKSYGEVKKEDEAPTYGFALASEAKLDKAYPLWIAYLYASSPNPFQDVKNRLVNDGMLDKYKPEYIVGLIEHTNELMNGKSESEKKDFYMNSINGILTGEDSEINMSVKNDIEI